jgi:hypothetical protein
MRVNAFCMRGNACRTGPHLDCSGLLLGARARLGLLQALHEACSQTGGAALAVAQGHRPSPHATPARHPADGARGRLDPLLWRVSNLHEEKHLLSRPRRQTRHTHGRTHGRGRGTRASARTRARARATCAVGARTSSAPANRLDAGTSSLTCSPWCRRIPRSPATPSSLPRRARSAPKVSPATSWQVIGLRRGENTRTCIAPRARLPRPCPVPSPSSRPALSCFSTAVTCPAARSCGARQGGSAESLPGVSTLQFVHEF